MVTQEELMVLLSTEVDPPVPGADPDAGLWEMRPDGEVVALQTPALQAMMPIEITTLEQAEDALAVRMEIELAQQAAAARTKAMLANCKALEAVEARRMSWWEYLFGAAVRKFGRTILKGTCKTARLAHGQLQYRTSRPTHTIVSMEEAVRWMRDRRPAKVKVEESVNVTDVLEELAIKGEGLPGWVKATVPEEKVNIVSNVGK
jgi:hypothetical protein